MGNSYKDEGYLTIKEYAEIKGITKQAVFYMVKGGKLADVKEIELPGKNRKMYLISKENLTTPYITQDVAVVKHELNPLELQQIIALPIQKELDLIRQALEKMSEEQRNLIQTIKEQNMEIEKLRQSKPEEIQQDSILTKIKKLWR